MAKWISEMALLRRYLYKKGGDLWGKVALLKAWWQGFESEACVTKVGGDRSQQIEVIPEVWVFT